MVNVLVVGSGGREHAISWKLAQSPRLAKLFITPGNPGTAQIGRNIDLLSEEIAPFCQDQGIDLVVIGPEDALACGLVDRLAEAGIPAFGPTQQAAQLESSKIFAKDFMKRHGIPTAQYATFQDYEKAKKHIRTINYPIVVKASGLAAGKGVLIPNSMEEAIQALEACLVKRSFGEAGEHVVIEERLSGEEVSILAFTDGKTVYPMPPAQDHKRLLEEDQGPNTGGMGAFAPTPTCPPEMLDQLVRQFLQPAVDGMAKEGAPYKGVLYAGLILTDQGPKLLEFNCRFGDPETQVILPLLDNDLIDIAEACIHGNLHNLPISWKKASAACIVMASKDYPYKASQPSLITGLEKTPTDALVFHAGTKLSDSGNLLASGGRVMSIVCTDHSLAAAVNKAYTAVASIQFDGMQYRRDIGQKVVKKTSASAYAEAGVNIDAGNQAVTLMRAAVKSTYGPQVLNEIGAFGGLFDISQLKPLSRPVLVASTDGVGTKVDLASQAEQFNSIGQDLVNHCINDILVQGARPLFFLDYIASSKLDPSMAAEIVQGIAAACRQANCSLLGGETAEMPGIYHPGKFDLAGTIVGYVDYGNILPLNTICAGDILVGLVSSGPHTNGFSLIRKIFTGSDFQEINPETGKRYLDELLAPHRSYLPVLGEVLADQQRPVKALAHITGGGFFDNIARILPNHLDAVIQSSSWSTPSIFKVIQQRGAINIQEMYRVFNMGIGMVMVTAEPDLQRLQSILPEACYPIGQIIPGEGKVKLV